MSAFIQLIGLTQQNTVFCNSLGCLHFAVQRQPFRSKFLSDH